MTTLELADHLDLADDLMRLGRIRHLPVVSHGKLVGVVSQRDLYKAAVSSVLQLRRRAEKEWLEKIRVQEVMTTEVFTIAPERPVRDAVELMLAKRIGCLPVVEKDGSVVGLLSESDCMRHLARVLEIAEEKNALPELPSST